MAKTIISPKLRRTRIEKLRFEQSNCCACCREERPEADSRLCYDKVGKKLLCPRCTQVLGLSKNDLAYLELVKTYLITQRGVK